MTEGSTLSWALRLQAEGHEVRVYHASPEHRGVGEGLVPIERNRDAWMAWGVDDPTALWFFDCTSTDSFDHGFLADRLRAQGRLVVGAGRFMDRLEKDRTFGCALAERSGILCPPTYEFSTVGEAVHFIRAKPPQSVGDGGWAWKSDRYLGQSATYVGDPDEMVRYLEAMIVPRHGDRIKCIVQERIRGTALSTARWWNGSRFVGPFEGTLEHKKLCDGDVGPSTGCALNLVWFYAEDAPKVAKALQWDRLEATFRAKQAPPGLYDINAVVARSGAWFLEWTPRLGIDSELTSQRGISNLGELLVSLARGADVDYLFNTEQAYMSVRLWVPPYPADKVDMDSIAMGGPIMGVGAKHFVPVGVAAGKDGLTVADPYGFVGAALAAGTSLAEGFESVYAYLQDSLVVPDLGYRTDAVRVLQKDIQKMAKAGYYTTDVLELDNEEAA